MELFDKALVVYRKTMGENHLVVAHTYNKMATALRAQGKLHDAMGLYKKALKVYMGTKGEYLQQHGQPNAVARRT